MKENRLLQIETDSQTEGKPTAPGDGGDALKSGGVEEKKKERESTHSHGPQSGGRLQGRGRWRWKREWEWKKYNSKENGLWSFVCLVGRCVLNLEQSAS